MKYIVYFSNIAMLRDRRPQICAGKQVALRHLGRTPRRSVSLLGVSALAEDCDLDRCNA
jgi:hypothetical protein